MSERSQTQKSKYGESLFEKIHTSIHSSSIYSSQDMEIN